MGVKCFLEEVILKPWTMDADITQHDPLHDWCLGLITTKGSSEDSTKKFIEIFRKSKKDLRISRKNYRKSL